jgi:hypothetical protein
MELGEIDIVGSRSTFGPILGFWVNVMGKGCRHRSHRAGTRPCGKRCFPFFRHLSLLYTDAQLFGNYRSPVEAASEIATVYAKGIHASENLEQSFSPYSR